MKKVFAAALACAVTACVPMEISAPFSAKEVSYINNRGGAKVDGQAFLRQQGGGVVTCAGSGVALIPAGAYATELFTKAFGNREGGVAGAFTAAPESTPPEFTKYIRKSQCDAQGNFEFSGVPNGDYYVVSKVVWTVGSNVIPEGGVVGRRISVSGGSSQRVLVSG